MNTDHKKPGQKTAKRGPEEIVSEQVLLKIAKNSDNDVRSAGRMPTPQRARRPRR